MERAVVAKYQKKVYKAFDNVIDLVVVGILLFLMACGAYAVWDNQALADNASATQWQPYKPRVPSEMFGFHELQAMNPDVVGWLDIYGTNIDYPLLYTQKHNKYLTLNSKGDYSLSGSIFLDPESDPDFKDLTTIIYGHHMEADAMFGGLDQFYDKEYFYEHQFGRIYLGGRDWGLEIMAIFGANAYDMKVYNAGIRDEETQHEYEAMVLDRALIKRNQVPYDYTGKLVVMSTCANEATNGRTVVVARVLDQVPEDTFLDWPNTGTGIDIQWTLFGIVWYVWAFGLIVILSAVGLILTAPYSKKNRKKEQAAKEARKAEQRQAETDISSAILHNNEDSDKLEAEPGQEDSTPPEPVSGSGAEPFPSQV